MQNHLDDLMSRIKAMMKDISPPVYLSPSYTDNPIEHFAPLREEVREIMHRSDEVDPEIREHIKELLDNYAENQVRPPMAFQHHPEDNIPVGPPYRMADGDPTDYGLMVGAIETHLKRFIIDDDVAEVAIYTEAIAETGRYIEALEKEVDEWREKEYQNISRWVKKKNSLRVEFKLQDMWKGIYWKLDHGLLEVWYCHIWFFPIHLTIFIPGIIERIKKTWQSIRG
jgi:hypothetical protein